MHKLTRSLPIVALFASASAVPADQTQTDNFFKYTRMADQYLALCVRQRPEIDPLLCLTEHGFLCEPEENSTGYDLWLCTRPTDGGRFEARVFYGVDDRDSVRWKSGG